MPVLISNYEYVKAHPYIDAIAVQYAADLARRFTTLKSLVWQSIVKNDCFRLRPGHIVAMAESLRPPFEFTDNPAKVQMFMKWLNDAEDSEILEVTKREGRQVVAHSEWQNIYVRRSYEKGIAFAERKLAEAGIAVTAEEIRDVFNRPIHADALGMLYTRNFTELQGITEAMDQQISRVLADGLAQGMNPRAIARAINNRVDKIGITRARTLARTEVNRAQNEATLNRYSDYGVKKVEWVATSSRPCPICAVNDGSIHTREEARGLLPAHPNCRCTWSPVIEKARPTTPQEAPPEEAGIEKWAAELTPAEQEAFQKWQGDDYFFIRMFEQGKFQGPPRERAELSRTWRILQAALDKAPKYKGVAYRGIYHIDDNAYWAMKNGKEIVFDATSSASRKKEVAQTFAEMGHKGHSILFKIRTKTGVELNGAASPDLADEAEIILRRGTKYRVKKWTELGPKGKFGVKWAEVELEEI